MAIRHDATLAITRSGICASADFDFTFHGVDRRSIFADRMSAIAWTFPIIIPVNPPVAPVISSRLSYGVWAAGLALARNCP